MKLLDLYSTTLGVKINPIDVKESFFPLPFRDYVTFHPFSKNSKNYSHWNLVLDIIRPALESRNLKLVQIGGPGEQSLNGVHSLVGQTTIRQASFVVKHSKLHICTDTFSSHLSGFYGVPTVVLVSNNRKENVEPYFKNGPVVVLEPDREKFPFPSYSLDDIERQIDTIPPEDIAKTILGFLGVDYTHPYKLLYSGFNTKAITLEVVPNQIFDPKSCGLSNVVVRMDYLFDERVLAAQMRECPTTIVTNKPLSGDLLRGFFPRIAMVYYELDDNHTKDFPQAMSEVGIKYVMFSRKSEEWIQNLKLDYMDYGVIHHKKIETHQSIDEIKDIPVSDLWFKSHKIVVSAGRTYASKYHWLNGETIGGLECPVLPFVDSSDVLGDLDYLQIFRKTP